MKFRFLENCVLALFLLAISSLISIPATAQSGTQPPKAPCMGCSVDGKTTPRTSDGHPDLSGFWNNRASNHLYSRTDDGSLLFDFGGGSL